MDEEQLRTPPYEEPRDERYPAHFEKDALRIREAHDLPGPYYDIFRKFDDQVLDLGEELDIWLNAFPRRIVLPEQDLYTREGENREELVARQLTTKPYFLVWISKDEEHRWHEVHERLLELIDENFGALELFVPRIVRYDTWKVRDGFGMMD